MEEGSVIKVAFTQADGQIKHRPAIAIKSLPPYNDWLACAISKSIDLEVKGFDLVLNENHPDYKESGLTYPGLIRLGVLSTVPENLIEGTIGKVSKETVAKLIVQLVDHLIK